MTTDADSLLGSGLALAFCLSIKTCVLDERNAQGETEDYHGRQDNPGNAAFILGDSNSRVLLVGENEQWQAMAHHRESFPDLGTVVALDQTPKVGAVANAYHVQDWLSESMAVESVENAPDGLATIVYTSGTTGRPKGVMLSHRNILSNTEAISGIVKLFREDVFLSFLPLSHML